MGPTARLALGAVLLLAGCALLLIAFTPEGPRTLATPAAERDGSSPVLSRAEPQLSTVRSRERSQALAASETERRPQVAQLATDKAARGALRVHLSAANARAWTSPATLRLDEGGLAALSSRTIEASIGSAVLFEGIHPGWVNVSVEQRASAAVWVRPGKTEDLHLEIPAGLAVAGQVVDRNHRGVAHAAVLLAVEPTHPESALIACTSGSDGTFRLLDVVPGSALSARSPQHQAAPLHILPRERSSDPDAPVAVTLRLGPPSNALRGRVVDTRGQGLPGARIFAGVRLDDQLGLPAEETLEGVAPPSTALADAQGYFELEGLAPDRTHPVWAGKLGFAATRAMLRADASAEEREIELVPEAILEGLVVHADGRPAESVYLWCISRKFTPRNRRFSGPSWAAEFAQSDDAGAFALRSLQPGPGLLRARLDGEMRDLDVHLESGLRTHVRVVLGSRDELHDPTRSLHGLVQDGRGEGVPGARVIVRSPVGDESVALSDGRGQFELTNAPLDATALKVFDQRTSWPHPALDTSRELWPWLNVQLPYADLAAGVHGELPAECDLAVFTLSSGALLHRMEVRPSGASRAFQTGPLPPGTFHLRAELQGVGAVDLGDVELVAGQALEIGALGATGFGQLVVRVPDPRASAPAQVHLSALADGVLRTRPIESGSATFDELPAGSYTVAFWDPSTALDPRPIVIEAGAVETVRLSPDPGHLVRFQLSDRGEPLSMLRLVWKESASGETLWDMGLLPWTQANLADLSVRLAPGSYTLEISTAAGLESRTSFHVDGNREVVDVNIAG